MAPPCLVVSWLTRVTTAIPGHHGDPGSPWRSRVTTAIPGHHGDPGSPRRSRVTTAIPGYLGDPGLQHDAPQEEPPIDGLGPERSTFAGRPAINLPHGAWP